MDITYDPHSSASPEVARVIDTRLELNVDFKRKVLEGKAILTIEKKALINEIILDNLGLNILSVTDMFGIHLDYQIEDSQVFEENPVLGSRFCVQLPGAVDVSYFAKCKTQIKYETNPDSPALYWLTPEQTADGLNYPFLLSNNKLIYARAWFPCQDTPSVKFTYSAEILVPKNLRVLMSALLKNVYRKSPVLDVYEFCQENPVPSYAVIIAVGSLQTKQLNTRTNVFAEMNFDLHKNVDKLYPVQTMLETGERLCGYYFWDRYDICVLPRSIAHFKIECPCVTFIPPSLLSGDISLVSSLAENISQSWAGNLVTCENYEHLWLNRSFSTFIWRKIYCRMLIHEDMKFYLKREGLKDLNSMVEIYGNAGLLNCLIPNLAETLPHEGIKYVPYERGCVLLDHLENLLGGPSVFEPFLKSYFLKFACKSIKTQDWKDHLYQYFPDKKQMLDGEQLDSWYFDNTPPSIEDLHLPEITAWEKQCLDLAKKCVDGDYRKVPDYPKELCDAQKIIFLNHLHSFYMDLDKNKLRKILHVYSFENKHTMTEIRFLWLLLCIKIQWDTKVYSALDFATEFCSPNYACPIFLHLYEWKEMREIAIEKYIQNKEKMLDETQEELETILNLPS